MLVIYAFILAGTMAMAIDPSSDKDVALIVTSFFLGIQVSEAVLQMEQGAVNQDEVVELLAKIAKGEETVLPSGADLRQTIHLEDADVARRQNQKLHEVVSRLILEWLANKLG